MKKYLVLICLLVSAAGCTTTEQTSQTSAVGNDHSLQQMIDNRDINRSMGFSGSIESPSQTDSTVD